jgi:hypothetical protein
MQLTALRAAADAGAVRVQEGAVTTKDEEPRRLTPRNRAIAVSKVRRNPKHCKWADTHTFDRASEGANGLKLLVGLYAAALNLPALDVVEELEPPGVNQEEWDRVYRRFGSLPVGYYSEIFDPLTVPPEEPVVGDLADDLADIYRDVRSGLQLYEAGAWPAATDFWLENFRIDWGRHALSALCVLHAHTNHAA